MDDITKTLPTIPITTSPTTPASSMPSMSSAPNLVGIPSATNSSPAPENPKEQADVLDQILKDLEKQYQAGDGVEVEEHAMKLQSTPPIIAQPTIAKPSTPNTTKTKEDPIVSTVSTAPKPMMTSGMKAAIGGSVTPMKPVTPPVPPIPPISPNTPESSSKPANKPGVIQKIGGVKVTIGAAALVLAVGGLVTVNILVKQPQDLQQKAFTGASVNAQKILAKVKDAPANPDKLLDLTNQKDITTVYKQLTDKYAGKGDTEQQDINEPSTRVKGVAYLKYEPVAVGTFVWLRIENLPLPNKKLVHVWVSQDGATYVNVGTAAFVKENGSIVAYNTFIYRDDLRTYKNLVFSYDTPQQTVIVNSQPEDIVLTVNF